MKYLFLFTALLFLAFGCTTPIEKELKTARKLCTNLTGYIYEQDYRADKCDILDFIKNEVAQNFDAKTYYASVELIKGLPISTLPCPEKIMQKDTALIGRFKPLRERIMNSSDDMVYYIEQDKKVGVEEHKIRIKAADRGKRYVISVEILLDAVAENE